MIWIARPAYALGIVRSDWPHYHAKVTALLTLALDDVDQLAMAAPAFAECLVGPARRSEQAIQVVRGAFDRLPIQIVDLSPVIATEAARLRARHRTLRLPDALVIATAVIAGADRLVTTDRRWPTKRKLQVDLEIVQT
ncbi:MAG TPA: PIN domain-containing protein [Microthrixaceae bacterium]|nr:PIN domain-containing protein [Microthrixaceae bacterium]